MLKKSVSALLVVSLLLSTVGCTSFKTVRENESLDQSQGNPIEVYTTEGSRYLLREWSQNTSGDVIGSGTFYGQDLVIEVVSDTIRSDHISAIKVKKSDAVKSALLGGIVVVSAAGLAYLVYLVVGIASLVGNGTGFN